MADDVVRRAPCSVLVARRRPSPAPSRIACGIDSSDRFLAPAAVAAGLAERFDARLELITALGVKPVDVERLGVDCRLDIDSALEADLVVVGSRGLHGIRCLGSVSARVAARADCSVLVVRHD